MKKALHIVILTLLAVSCGRGLDRQAEQKLYELSAAGELVTCEYSVSKVVKADDMVWWKIGERKILFNCKATLQAGIDMAKYDPEKTKVDRQEKSVVLVLPEPEVLSINMPADQITQEYSHVTGFRFDFTAEERNELLKEGERSIRAEIPSMGILRDAKLNAVSYFETMLSELGFEIITITFEGR